MKSILVKVTALLITFISLSATAQINSGIGGYMHGGNKGEKDTGTKSIYVDVPKSHEHADTTLLKKKPTAASEARAEAKGEGKGRPQGSANQSDTAPMSAAADTASPSAGTSALATTSTTTDCNCMSPSLGYAAIAVFGLAALIGLILILLLLRKKKEEDERNGKAVR